jgi:hypothetical protein
LTQLTFIALLGFAFITGVYDSTLSIGLRDDYPKLLQTFRSAQYLAERSTSADQIIKDHNYIDADSWMKLFFMRGYKYPQSRGYFKRYDDTTKPREMCTLYMISNPSGKEAVQCFAETGTDFVMINPVFDSAQFKKLDNFNQIYASPNVAIYYRK